MKKLTWILAVSLILTLCIGLASCKPTVNPDQTPVHTHSYTDGKCECGENDPNYVPPHQHAFEGGKCECGEIDPNHECIFYEGKCIICFKDDPYPNYAITGDYGVTAEVVGNCTVTVNTIDVKSDEYEDLSLTLEEGSVNILDKAWVMYNVTIQPEEEEGEVKLTTGKVSVPAPIPGVEEYLVYEVQDTKVEEIEYEYVNDYIVVNTWNYNYNYLVTTEESFNVVEYYENNDTATKIPQHINVGEDKAEDAYQKGQTRTLEVYACINGLKLADDEYAVSAEGFKWTEYNQLGKELYYQQTVHISAQPYIGNVISHEDFIGWYIGDFDENGNIVLENNPYYTDLELDFEMPAKDLKLFAVYAHTSSLRITGNMSLVSVDGDEFYDYVTAKVNPLQKYITLSAQPLENCYFSHWAYADDPHNPDCFISNESTFAYEIPAGELRDIVAVCEPYSKYTYTAYSVCSDPASEYDYAEYRFIVNGKDYYDDFYADTFWEYESFSITAVSVRGCKFVGWAVIGLRDELTYDGCKDKITSTDPTYIINKDNCSNFKNNILVAVYEMLPQYSFSSECYFVDDNYGSFASIYINGDARGDNFYTAHMAEGEQVTVKAVPEMNCRFEGWYYVTLDESGNPVFGDLASMDAEFTFTMGKEDTLIYAKLRCYPTYSVSAYAGEGGDIYINGENHYGSVRHAYEEGEKLTVKIEVKEGFEFKGWYVNNDTHEVLLTTDLAFEYTVGTSDASFVARVEPIPMYSVVLKIPTYGIIVEFDGVECAYVEGYLYATKRMEGATVTLKAIDSLDGREFSYWNINGKRVASREYSFVVGTENVEIQAYSRAKITRLELAFRDNVDGITPTYSTNYETGERYLSGVNLEVKTGTRLNYGLPEFLQIKLIDKDNNVHSYNIMHLQELCDIDWGGSIPAEEEDYYYVAFSKVGIYTFTVTDKTNPELTASITIVVEGVDETGNYVWISRTGTKYHLYPTCSNMKTATLICKDDAIEKGYEPCKICYGE